MHVPARYKWNRTITLPLLALLLAIGCRRETTEPAPPQPADAAPLSADEVLQRMVDAYQQAQAYSDRGVLKLKYPDGGAIQQQQAEMSIGLVRPNRLSARVYQLSLACDGDKLRARIADEMSGNVDRQFVERAAPQPLTLDEMYADQLLYGAMQGGMAGHPVQLELLLADNPLAALRSDAAAKTLKRERGPGAVECHHVIVKTSQGEFGLWIDPESYALLRLDYPSEPQSGAELTAEFTGAAFSAPEPDLFKLEAEPQEKVVEFFVPPTQPLPSDLFGNVPGDFTFVTLAGEQVSSQSLLKKAAVLAWFQDDPGCRANLAQLEGVRRKFTGQGNVAFFAVCSDVTMSAATIENLLSSWSVELAGLQDPQLHGRDLFRIRGVPTVVVLGPQGKVHYFEEQNNPNVAQILPEVIGRILDGEDIGGDIAWRYQQERAQYERDLAAAMGDQEAAAAPITPLAPQSAPRHMQLTRLWTSDALQQPGNFLVFEAAGGETAIFVHDGLRAIARLDAQGQLIARHELDLPADAGISFLRTAVDAAGRRWFAAASIMGRQAHVFDENWQLALSYPPPEQPHAGVRDVQLAQLGAAEGANLQLLIGFWDEHGAQGVNLDGELLWSRREHPTVLSLALEPQVDQAAQRALITGDHGRVLVVNEKGDLESEIEVPDRPVHHLYAKEPADRSGAVYCSLTYQPRGSLEAAGLSGALQPVWTYPLPAGVYENDVQLVASGRLLSEAGEWLLAGSDGTIHIISSDGALRDSFGYGQYLAGIAVAQIDGQGALLVSAGNEVTAWRVERN